MSVPATDPAVDGRVAATPETVTRLVERGIDVTIESGAGTPAGYADAAYEQAGATIADRGTTVATADVLAVVGPPSTEDVAQLREGSVVVGLLAPHRNLGLVAALADRGVTSLALELLPRISRAQPLDALSSQSGVAGYKAVLLAAVMVDKMFPLSMTAAGTVSPASVVVLGAGVAGLQAIATARRLGAMVKANDVRAAAADEVTSLGGRFIHIPGVTDQTEGSGYARALGADLAAAQHEALAPHIADADVVLCTAAIPGRRAPVLVTEAMVASMRAGSVVIDMPADDGGNCELTDPGREIDRDGVRIVPAIQLARTMPREASALYARNVGALLDLLTGDDGQLVLDREDEVVTGLLLTDRGTTVHEPTAQAIAAASADSAPAKEGP